jgi:hypothetical protein
MHGNRRTLYDLRFSRRWLWRMQSSEMLRCLVLVRTDVLEEGIASIIRVTRIGGLGTLALTSNRSACISCNSTRYVMRLHIIGFQNNEQDIYISAGHATPPYMKNLALIWLISGGSTVGIVCLRTKSHGVCFIYIYMCVCVCVYIPIRLRNNACVALIKCNYDYSLCQWSVHLKYGDYWGAQGWKRTLFCSDC